MLKRNLSRTAPATITVLIAILVMAATLLYGAAEASTHTPGQPQKPMTRLIAGDGEQPQVRISWDAPDASTVNSHTVRRNDGQTFDVPGGATTYSDRSIVPGTTYSYTVSATNDGGSSPESEPATAVVPAAPSAPGGMTATAAVPELADTSASVTTTWMPATAPEAGECQQTFPVTAYVLERVQDGEATTIATIGPEAVSFTDDEAGFGTAYTYRVYATSDIGNGPAATATAATTLRPVGMPTGLTAAIADPFDGNVTLSWNAPDEGPAIAAYLVLRYLGDDPDTGTDIPVTVDENAAGTTVTDATAEAGVVYSYMILAISIDGNVSDPSNTALMEAPAPPTGMAAAAGDGAISLSWSPPAAGVAALYRVARQEQDGAWTHLTDVAETSHDDDTAKNGATYRYRVQHRNIYGGSTWSTSGTVTMTTAPGAPTGVSATADGDDNVVTWTAPDSPSISGYHVRHRAGDGEWSSLSDTIGAMTLTHTHEDAAADVTHQYAVRAHNPAGNGPWSESISTTRVTPPVAPTGVSAVLDGDDIVLKWTRPDSVHVDGYTVRHRAGTDGEFIEGERLAGTATSHSIPDTTGDTVYRLQVRAHNAGGDGPWSEAVEIERVLLPSTPTSVSIATDDVNITLSWSAPETGRVAGYHVNYGIAASEARRSVDRNAEQTSFVHTDSVEGTPYTYQVRAHNSAGNGPWSEPVQATRLLTPGAPTNLKAAASAGVSVIDVIWQAPEGSIVATYEVEYGLSSGIERVTASVTSDHNYFTHTDSEGDVEYEYRVRSVNAAGQSSWTDPVTATRVTVPGRPTDVDAAISGTDIEVTWSAPGSVFINGYHLELRQEGLENWTRHTVTGATSFTHESPDAGTPYQYRVRTQNAGGVSPWSTTAEAIWYQGAAPPTAIIIQPWNANTQLLVRWTASQTDGVTGYELRHRIDGGDWSNETTEFTFVFHSWNPDGEDLREYSVRSLKDSVYGDWSAIRRFDMALPAAVTNVVTNLEGQNGVRLHWDEPDSGQPTQYFIEYDTGTGNWARSGTSIGYQRTHRFASQPYDSTYSYRVTAVNDVYMTGAAGEVSVTMGAEPRNFTDMPAGLNIKMLDSDRVRLTWSAPADFPGDVSGYRIYRREVADDSVSPRFRFADAIVLHTGSTGTRYVDLTALPERMYAYAVAAYRPSMGNRLSPASHPAYAQPW